jgi:hypothetical protein
MDGTPGSQRRNWSPAETVDDYLRNVEEGLEPHSDRRFAKLMGVSRTHLYRVNLIAQLPDDLFDALLKQRPGPPKLRELANIALAMRGHDTSETDRCPHCSGVLRRRLGFTQASADIVNRWIEEQRSDGNG